MIKRNERDYLEYRKGSGETVEIYDIAVYSERHRGTGRSMFNELLETVPEKRIFAFTRRSNKPAHLFYEGLGFVGYDIPNFYPDGDAKLYIYERS